MQQAKQGEGVACLEEEQRAASRERVEISRDHEGGGVNQSPCQSLHGMRCGKGQGGHRVDMHVAWIHVRWGVERGQGTLALGMEAILTLSSSLPPSPCPTSFAPTHFIHLFKSHAFIFLPRHLRHRIPDWGSCCLTQVGRLLRQTLPRDRLQRPAEASAQLS